MTPKDTVRLKDSVKKEFPNFHYIYDFKDQHTKLVDSFLWYSYNHEKTLELYVDSLPFRKFGDMFFYFDLFDFYGDRYAIMIDSVGAIYKLEKGHFKKLYRFPEAGIACQSPALEMKDLNMDGHKDLLLSINSCGLAGDLCYLLFYDPNGKSLRYDPNIELRNLEFIPGEKKLVSYFRWSYRTYKIDGFNLKLFEDVVDLGATCDSKFAGFSEVIKYDENEKIFSRDTVNYY